MKEREDKGKESQSEWAQNTRLVDRILSMLWSPASKLNRDNKRTASVYDADPST
jgi:hypothetical protein